MRLITLSLWFALLAGAALLPAASAYALSAHGSVAPPQPHAKTAKIDPKQDFKPGVPAILEADQVEYDRTNNIVTATGHATVVQGDTVLMADRLTYHKDTGEAFADGNASLLEPTGNVYFADHMQLQGELKIGTVEQFKGRLADNSLIAANYAKRVSEDVTDLFRAAYTPCRICGGEHPLWEIDADRAVYDTDQQQVIYHDAFFESYGMPVFYTPYFSHATPGAENQSGFLTPHYRYSTNLGSTYHVPYYYVFGQDKDATITPVWTSLEGLLVEGQYRQAFDSGQLHLAGSITRPQDRDAAGTLIPGRQTRGYIEGVGKFALSDNWDWGFDARRATDQTYLNRYFNNAEPVLNSRLYVEGFGFAGNERAYASAQGLSFQGLQPGDDPHKIPIIAPLLDYSTQSNQDDYGGRLKLDANMMSLYRKDGDGSRRLASLERYELPYLTDSGQLITFGAQTRLDAYSVTDVTLEGGSNYTGTTGRAVPEINALWRWPFIKSLGEKSSWVVEPTLAVAVSPGGGNPQAIPNEDSQIPEFTDANLFSFNRFTGWDRVESGPRATYGVRSELQFEPGHQLDVLLGQEYRLDNDSLFPFSNTPNSHFSDYVGRLGLTYNPVTLSYRFRFDHQSLAASRQEVDLQYHGTVFNGGLTYLSLRNDPVLGSKHEVVPNVSYKFAEHWTFNSTIREDLLLRELTQTSAGVEFKNECFGVSTMLARDFTRIRDVKPETSVNVQFSLQSLGSKQ